MKTVVLTRFESTSQGTFGKLQTPEGLVLFSGELPWRDNAPNYSCIPPGTYECKWTYSPAFKRPMYLVTGVPRRTGIRKHAANFMGDVSVGFKSQLHGCIALGEKIGWIQNQKALLLSAPAIRRFEALMKQEPFTLEVINGSALTGAD
jgi:hypothetical protein